VSYCTKQNLIDRFGEQELIQLTDRANLGVINDTVLNQAISDADAEINGYLTAYPLPLANVPANLVRIACDVARYYLYADVATDRVTRQYDRGITYLVQITKGLISLGPDAAGTVSDTTSNSAEFSSSPSVFGRE
jgi:phage gp36-like protein